MLLAMLVVLCWYETREQRESSYAAFSFSTLVSSVVDLKQLPQITIQSHQALDCYPKSTQSLGPGGKRTEPQKNQEILVPVTPFRDTTARMQEDNPELLEGMV